MNRWLAVVALVLAALPACGDNEVSPIEFGTIGSLSADSGKGSFRFGIATAATQIEDGNVNTDWYQWTLPTAQGGLGNDHFVGSATDGYTMDLSDVGLVAGLGVDSYRFSIEWARIEPVKGQIDEAAIAHYRAELQALHDAGIRPLVTLHHFSNPQWVASPTDPQCTNGPSDTDLCGFGSPGGELIGDAMAAHAALLAQRFGDLVDEWGTVNEPMNYLLESYGVGAYPPGRNNLFQLTALFVPVVRDYISAHAKMYKAIKANDLIDADGDGVAASVGMSLAVADWEPSRANALSTDPDDIAARDRLVYVFHYVWADSVLHGTFDSNLDGTPDELHPEWAGTLDWLGLQYYTRAGVSADRALVPVIALTPCIGGFDNGSCLPAIDPSYCVPRMGYEFWSDGLHDILTAFGARYPGLPLVVTESGISTDTGTRRAEAVVRVLESIARAITDGVDVRGYYHWSLTDNFEWAEGFGPHFGLYSVDYPATGTGTYARTATEGATVLGDIAHARTLTSAQRKQYGGLGPLTPEAGFDQTAFCTKVPAP